MSRRIPGLVGAVLSIAALGCGEADQETAPTFVTVDSAGVEILRLSDLHALDLPPIEMRLVYSTAPNVELASVAGAVFLPDSSLAIADRRSAEIVFLEPDGRVRARSGREGEGPGEYTFIEQIGVGADGALFVYDRRQRRFTFLDSEGGLTGVQSLDQGTGFGAAVPLVRLEGGEVLAAFETRPELPPGLQRAPVSLVFADAAGVIVDTLAQWAGRERHVTRDGWNPVLFGATALFAGRGVHALMGTNDSLALTLYRGVEPVTRIRGAYSPRAITAPERDALTERSLGRFPEEVQRDWRRRLEASTEREAYPAYEALAVDPEGRMWIGDFPPPADPERRWTVLEPDGRPVGVLRLPVLHGRWGSLETVAITSEPHELVDVAHGRIAVLRRGEFDEEFIEVYEVELPR
ncbi:hypothetical protein [Candidatus Palauibacter sp.]|uniref:hypothetical protein n=1 Tax=Candidatus Palauibacter sp. TaxID=3101350 RepID=UPI003CC64D3A